MKTSTLVALKAILQSDPVRSYADRDLLMRTLGLGEGAARAPLDRIVSFEDAAKRLNRTPRSIHHLARMGVIKKAKLPGLSRCSGVRESDLNKLLSNIQ